MVVSKIQLLSLFCRYVNLTVSTKRERRDIYNVIGTVKGSIEPGTVRCNHFLGDMLFLVEALSCSSL